MQILKYKNNNNNSKKGFVILIAVVVSSLMLALGAFIVSVAIKELALSISGKNSQLAFYAADSAVECALYQDFHIGEFASSSDDTSGPSTVQCNSEANNVTITFADASSALSIFEVYFSETGQSTTTTPYASVRILKQDIGGANEQTTVEARGYNVYDSSLNSRVERALRVTY